MNRIFSLVPLAKDPSKLFVFVAFRQKSFNIRHDLGSSGSRRGGSSPPFRIEQLTGTVSGTVSERSRRQFWSADISGKQNSRSFFIPIYRESKTRAVFPSRYIGKAKLAQFSRPDISGRQNSRSFPVPIYRESKSRAVFPSRYIGKAKVAQFFHPDISGRQKSRSFPVPIYWETKTHAIFCHWSLADSHLSFQSRENTQTAPPSGTSGYSPGNSRFSVF